MMIFTDTIVWVERDSCPRKVTGTTWDVKARSPQHTRAFWTHAVKWTCECRCAFKQHCAALEPRPPLFSSSRKMMHVFSSCINEPQLQEDDAPGFNSSAHMSTQSCQTPPPPPHPEKPWHVLQAIFPPVLIRADGAAAASALLNGSPAEEKDPSAASLTAEMLMTQIAHVG